MTILEKLIGQIFDGKYYIEKQLGQGGMGAVYKATHLGTERPVAVKVIVPQFMAITEFVERFKIEAKAAGRLRHPNVVNVTDFGFTTVGTDKLAYMVMEYLDGCSLGDIFKKQHRLPLDFVIDIMEQVCLAIEEAHKQGILHRDLKPDNIWLEPNGRGGYNVKVLDFGLAKFRTSTNILCGAAGANASITSELSITETMFIGEMESDGKQEDTLAISSQAVTAGNINPNTVPEGFTRVGAILGTPLYMSPEQCKGEELDVRSDIYSLGIIVYQMLTGETPFTGNLFHLFLQHNETPPPPLIKKRPDIPRSVAAVVMSSLAKTPADRPPTAIAFATALRANAEGETPLLDQATEIYLKFRSVFIRISMLIYVPSIFLCFLLLWNSKILLLAIMPLLLITNSLHTAVCTLVIEQLRLSHSNTVQMRPVLITAVKRLGGLAITSFRSGVALLFGLIRFITPGLRNYICNSLYTPVVMIEKKQGEEALARSRELVNRLSYPTAAIESYRLLLASITMIVFLLITINTTITGSAIIKSYFIAVAFILLLIINLKHSPYAIAAALLYYKTREAGGEPLDESFNLDIAQEYIPWRPKASYKQTATLLFTLLVKQATVIIAIAVTLFILIITVQNILQPRNLVFAAEQGRVNTLKELLARGADINERDFLDNQTALICAAKHGHIDTVKVLLDAGPDVHAKDAAGKTALIYAAEHGYTDTLELLLAAGAKTDERDNDGKTALIYAAEHGYGYAIRTLIAGRADLNIRDSAGKTALTYATEKSRVDVAELLKAAAAAE